MCMQGFCWLPFLVIGTSGCGLVVLVGTCFIRPGLLVVRLRPLGVGAPVLVGVHIAIQFTLPGSRRNLYEREAVTKLLVANWKLLKCLQFRIIKFQLNNVDIFWSPTWYSNMYVYIYLLTQYRLQDSLGTCIHNLEVQQLLF